MASTKKGPEIFEALTYDETWILASKLTSGAIMSGHAVGGDHATTMEIHDVTADVQANWAKSQ